MEILNLIKGPSTVFEREPLQKLTKTKQLVAYKHGGYWKCMDNLNEKQQLDNIYKKKKTIWNLKN